jgi:hypothetical protein
VRFRRRRLPCHPDDELGALRRTCTPILRVQRGQLTTCRIRVAVRSAGSRVHGVPGRLEERTPRVEMHYPVRSLNPDVRARPSRLLC